MGATVLGEIFFLSQPQLHNSNVFPLLLLSFQSRTKIWRELMRGRYFNSTSIKRHPKTYRISLHPIREVFLSFPPKYA